MSPNRPIIVIDHADPNVRSALVKTFSTISNIYLFSDTTKPEALIIPLSSPPRRLNLLWQEIQHTVQRQQHPVEILLGSYRLNTRQREFVRDHEIIPLTEKEADILVYIYQAKRPVSRDDLLRDVWGYAADADTHTIETHIYRLRQKIETNPDQPEILITLKDGYWLAACSSA